MAARKQQDALCMFCFEVPCTCAGVSKKTSSPRKKLSQAPRSELVVELPEKIEIPKIIKPGISTLATNAKQEKDDSELHERAALTALFEGGFILEPIGDPRGFESVRPKLNMKPVDISIQLWKIRRRRWLESSRYK